MRIKAIFLYRFTIFLLLLSLVSQSFGQSKIKLLPGAKTLHGFKKDGISFTSVTGNVKFLHKETLFYCDSAILVKKTNYLEAYGHVKIIDGDSVVITSRELYYDGNTRIARLRKDVILTKLAQMQIFTDFLNYDRNTAIASYFNNGKIVDSTNVITSGKGYYNTRNNMTSFKTEVIAKNKDYTMTSDTLVYNTKTGIVYFVSPTTMVDTEGGVFEYEGGQYRSKQKRSNFTIGQVETEDYFLKGRSMHLDDIKGIYTVKGNVEMISKTNDVIITGQSSIYNKSLAVTKIFDMPMLKMINDRDTLFLIADTLISIDSKVEEDKRLLAYSNVRFFNNDIQGIADSMVYNVKDSVISLYRNPVLWSDQNQISADSIRMIVSNKTISEIVMTANSFVVTRDSLGGFNQIKGRNMIAILENQQLKEVNVTGNGESIFYMYDQESGIMLGLNKIICSDINLYFVEGRLEDAKFLVNPEGDFIPPHELKPENEYLKGFIWWKEMRPSRPIFKDYEFNPAKVPEKTYPKLLPNKKKQRSEKYKKG